MINTNPLINKNLDNVITLGKNEFDKLDLKGVVYEDYENCSFSYIGETKGAVKERLDKHINKKDPSKVGGEFAHER